MYTPLIPNSQLIIMRSTNKDDWDLDIMVNPSANLLFVAFVFLGFLVAICIVAMILHIREIRIDRKERLAGFIILA